MAIIPSEIKHYKSETVTDTTANGGYMSTVLSTSGVKNNVFPDVTEAERTAGITRYRKVFPKIENDADETLFNSFVHFKDITPADDMMTFFPGTQSDTQGDIGSPREYGAGTLDSDISAGGSTLDVNIEAALDIIQTGDTIYITDGTNEEYHTNVTAIRTASQIAITLDGGDTFNNSYAAATPTYISAVYEKGDVKTSFDSWVETSTSGTYDEATYPVEGDNIGGIEEDWTITFTDATNFTCAGARVGSVGGGSISSDFSPTNTDFTKPYFVLRSAGWGGTWAAAETITFTTHPASIPIWLKMVVPAGASSYSGNTATHTVSGESS